MALITFNCTKCGQKLSADKTLSESMTVCPVCAQAIKIPEFRLYAGMKLGEFVLKEQLGIGGMGEVWLAEQISMQRYIALKILSPSLSNNPDFCARFQNEAKNSGRLLHPNIVTSFAAGKEEDIYYLAMAYVDGVPLETELELCHRLQENQTLKIVLDIAEALKYAWDKFKIIHRDIKPSNIMITRLGNATLLDLGISKSLIDQSSVTRTGIFVGTPYYISPEQARNDADLDCRADIYSLGAVIYHMLSGHVPFNATTPMGVIARHLSEPLPNLRALKPRISEPVLNLIEKMMKKKKEQRYASWDEVIEAIRRIQTGKNSKVAKAERFVARNRQNIAFIVMVAIATMIIIAVIVSIKLKPSSAGAANANDDDIELSDSTTAAANSKNSAATQDWDDNALETNVAVAKGKTATTAAATTSPEATPAAAATPPPAATEPQRQPVITQREQKPELRPARNDHDRGGNQQPNQGGLMALLPFEMNSLRTLLDLTPEQSKQMATILRYARERLNQTKEKMRYADNSYKPELQKDMIQIRQETVYQLRNILNETQLKKWNELEKARRQLKLNNNQQQPQQQHRSQ